MLSTFTIPLQLVLQLAVPGYLGDSNATLAVGDATPQQIGTLPLGFTAFPNIGFAYKYFNDTATWNMARKTCIAHDSNLALIDSFEKVRIVNSISSRPNYSMWVGIHKLFGDAEWISVKTGLPVPVIPWAAEGTDHIADSDCLGVRTDGTGIFAGTCNMWRNFVCEIPL